VVEHAYRSTRLKLWRNRHRLGPLLDRHGIGLRTDVLEDPDADLWASVASTKRRRPPPVTERLDETLRQIEVLIGQNTKEVGHGPL
jgi:hypothetical protein